VHNFNDLPVIQGDADVGKRITEDELQKTIQFCGGVFLPIDPELQARVRPRLDSKLLDPLGPVVMPEEIERLVPDDIEAQMVLKEINARKGAGRAFSAVGSFSDEVAGGFSACVDRGRLGLITHTKNQHETHDPTTHIFVPGSLTACSVFRSRFLFPLILVVLALLYPVLRGTILDTQGK